MGEVKKDGGDRRDSRRNRGGQSWEERTREDMRRKRKRGETAWQTWDWTWTRPIWSNHSLDFWLAPSTPTLHNARPSHLQQGLFFLLLFQIYGFCTRLPDVHVIPAAPPVPWASWLLLWVRLLAHPVSVDQHSFEELQLSNILFIFRCWKVLHMLHVQGFSQNTLVVPSSPQLWTTNNVSCF